MADEQTTIAILFADIADSTPLYEAVGDVEGHRQVTQSLTYMAKAVLRENGRVLRTVGDATLASFSSCDAALQAACAIQMLHQETPLTVRCGFHYGSVIPDRGDVYGHAVNIAARVASFARGEEITATEHSVRQLSPHNRDLARRIDTLPVKGLKEPVDVYRIAWTDDTDMHTLIASRLADPQSSNVSERLKLSASGQTFDVSEQVPSLTIGRDQDCTVTSMSERASRKHASIDWVSGQIEFTDSSTNGSYICRHGRQALYVRRETVVLQGEGTIGIGDVPEANTENTLHFSIVNNLV